MSRSKNGKILAEVSRQREADAWRLRTQDLLSEAEIAGKLGVTQQAVSKILRRVEQRVWRELAKGTERLKAAQTARLESIFHRAIRAFERSLEDAVTIKESIAPIGPADDQGKQAEGEQTERTTKGQSGNAALLAQARGALADQRAIWGLDAPVKVGLGGPTGGPIGIAFVEVEMPVTDGSSGEAA